MIELLKSPNIEIKINEFCLIDSYSELVDGLNFIPAKSQLNFLYRNRNIIKNLLNTQDEIQKIDKETLNENDKMKYYFSLAYLVGENLYCIIYSYDFDIVNELYSFMIKEQKKFRKLLLYIFAYIIIYNFEGLDESASREDEINKIYKEIEIFMLKQQPILDEFKLNLNLNDYKCFNGGTIDNLYTQVIISLIKYQKLSDYEFSKDIMEQLGLGTIEITHRMFCQLKEEFENIYFEQYIDCYKLTNFDDLFNKQIINFYYLLLKYVFKSQIYIYNISFLLDVRKSIIIIVRGNLEKLLSDIDNLKEKNLKKELIIY